MTIERLLAIKALLFDIDGVLTDGSVTLMPDGTQVRHLNIKDCYALQLAVKKGFLVGIISGGKSEMLRERLASFGIEHIYMGVARKTERFDDLLIECELSESDCLYMGDDIPDYEVMQRCGISACPADAAHDIQQIALYVCKAKGGKGAVREVVEQVLRAQDKWMDADAFSW
ncbi:MAG: hypothetical protein RLZZ543_1594 [Bacteroidota bacterium]|jgi:3-deoxy-D-manno-octulosonate 8-phosphate phosphatase (KDO 8-P phosphatase)